MTNEAMDKNGCCGRTQFEPEEKEVGEDLHGEILPPVIDGLEVVCTDCRCCKRCGVFGEVKILEKVVQAVVLIVFLFSSCHCC